MTRPEPPARRDAGEAALGPFATPDPDQFYRFAFADPVNTRQVRLEAAGSTGRNTGAKEIQFFAKGANDDS